jgi:hypothetical protein
MIEQASSVALPVCKIADPLFVQILLPSSIKSPARLLVSFIEPTDPSSQTETEYPVEHRESFLDCRHYACLYDSAIFPVNRSQSMTKDDADALVLFKSGPQILVTFSLSYSLPHRIGGHPTSGSPHLTFAEITGGRKETY